MARSMRAITNSKDGQMDALFNALHCNAPML
jgi:hypothetical protein